MFASKVLILVVQLLLLCVVKSSLTTADFNSIAKVPEDGGASSDNHRGPRRRLLQTNPPDPPSGTGNPPPDGTGNPPDPPSGTGTQPSDPPDPPSGTGNPPDPPSDTGGPPDPPSGTGMQPSDPPQPSGTGNLPDPPSDTGNPPDPPSGTGIQPSPLPEGTDNPQPSDTGNPPDPPSGTGIQPSPLPEGTDNPPDPPSDTDNPQPSDTGNPPDPPSGTDNAPQPTDDQNPEPTEVKIMMNETLMCGDSVRDTLVNGADRIETHSYEFEINKADSSSLFISSCGSATNTLLRLSESPDWRDTDYMECGTNGQYFITWNDEGPDTLTGEIEISSDQSGEYVLDILCGGVVSLGINCGDTDDVKKQSGGIDRYYFNVDATNYMEASFSTCDSDTILRVFDADNNRLSSNTEDACSFLLNWLPDYDASNINIDVISWKPVNYSFAVQCESYAADANIACGHTVFGNTLSSSGVNYAFTNPSDQSVIFDICAVSDSVDMTLYDSNWGNPQTEMFSSDEWRSNKTNCAHMEYLTLTAADYFLRIERPAAFVLDVKCNEAYAFPDPRTSDLIGDKCNYVQIYPEDEMWPIGECFHFGQPSEGFAYSMHWLCEDDGSGNTVLTQNWYNQTTECNKNGEAPWYTGEALDASEAFSYNCDAASACTFVKVQQFDECIRDRDNPADCMTQNGFESGAFIVDECFIIQTGGGFESVKRICADAPQSNIEMHYAGFDCNADYNYANITYNEGDFVENKYWLFGSCGMETTAPTTTGVETTTGAETTEDAGTTSAETTAGEETTTTKPSDGDDDDSPSGSARQLPFMFAVYFFYLFFV